MPEEKDVAVGGDGRLLLTAEPGRRSSTGRCW